MNLSLTKDKELRTRAKNWLYHIGVCTCDDDDIIQNAMIRLYDWHDKHPEVNEETFADVVWKRALNQAFVNWVVRTKSYRSMLERYADTLGVYAHREQYILEARVVLNQVIPELTESELLVILSLMESDFKVTWAAEEIGCSRQHVHQTLGRIRQRLSESYELPHNPASKGKAADVEYTWKRDNWNANHPTRTEVFDIDELAQEDFRDSKEEAKVWPVTIIKGEAYEQSR